MLRESEDLAPGVADSYRRSHDDETLVAFVDDRLDGMINGRFGTSLADNPAFNGFEIPEAPHAFLIRIFVRPESRGDGVGSSLLKAFVEIAEQRRCTFVGGSIDHSSDPSRRRQFFLRHGFSFNDLDNFGARTSSLRSL